MKVSELIIQLQRYLERYGDHEVVDAYDTPLSTPEEIDGVCVLAEKA
jgi:hypothetical protein